MYLLKLLTYIGIKANSVDPDPTGAVRSWSTLFVKNASKKFQQTTKQTTFVGVALTICILETPKWVFLQTVNTPDEMPVKSCDFVYLL